MGITVHPVIIHIIISLIYSLAFYDYAHEIIINFHTALCNLSVLPFFAFKTLIKISH